MRRKWRAEWVEGGMQHHIEFSTLGGGVRGAEFWLKAFMKDVGGKLPEVYHLTELSDPPEPTRFHSVLDWPHGREGILWIYPVNSSR